MKHEKTGMQLQKIKAGQILFNCNALVRNFAGSLPLTFRFDLILPGVGYFLLQPPAYWVEKREEEL